MCSCHSILECCVTFSGVKLSIRSFVLLFGDCVTISTWPRICNQNFKKNITLDVFRNGVMSLLCLKE